MVAHKGSRRMVGKAAWRSETMAKAFCECWTGWSALAFLFYKGCNIHSIHLQKMSGVILIITAQKQMISPDDMRKIEDEAL